MRLFFKHYPLFKNFITFHENHKILIKLMDFFFDENLFSIKSNKMQICAGFFCLGQRNCRKMPTNNNYFRNLEGLQKLKKDAAETEKIFQKFHLHF